MRRILLILGVSLLCFGCTTNKDSKEGLISYMEAKEMIINENAVLVDVRTEEEYNEHHIDGALLLTLDTIDETTATNIVNDKEREIIVYCRSGKRSALAKDKLESLGYTNVFDLGSIDNWKE